MKKSDPQHNASILNSIQSYFNSYRRKLKSPIRFDSEKIIFQFFLISFSLVFIMNFIFRYYIDWLSIHINFIELIFLIVFPIFIGIPVFYFLLYRPLNKQLGFRQNLLEELEAAEFNFLTMVNTSQDLIVVSQKSNGKILFANKSIEKIFGYKMGEILGKTTLELNLYRDPNDRLKWIELLDENGQVDNTEVNLCHKNGSEIHLLTSIVEIKIKNIPHLIFSGKDITEIKKKQEELIRLYKAIESSPLSIFITDINGIIEYANPTTSTTSGYKISEILGKNPKIFSSGRQNDENYQNLWNTILSGETWVGELQNKKKNGDFYWEKMTISPVKNEKNKITNFVSVKEDITKNKLMLEELIKAKDKAEESNQLKTEFLNNMSHEIRTPLNGILGFSNFLNNPDLNQTKQKQYINIIQQSGIQLMRVIDDILEISMLGTKKVTVKETHVNLNSLLVKQHQVFSLKTKAKKISFYLKTELLDKNSMILIDEVKLNKVISNLLENALKFTNSGYIELGYRINKKDKNFKKLEIYVKDTGIGIAKEKQETIFERFAQAEKELSKKVGGLGLGLSIAKENIVLMGGAISVESEPRKGAMFIVSLPYKQINVEPVLEQKIENVEVVDVCTMLIAEDEKLNFMYLESLIHDILKLDCNILYAKNGKKAVELVQSNPKISLVFMDLKMPIMSGHEATKKIKKIHPNLPVIAQTAYSTTTDKEKAFSAGCDDFISKPINLNEFKELLYKYKFIKVA